VLHRVLRALSGREVAVAAVCEALVSCKGAAVAAAQAARSKGSGGAGGGSRPVLSPSVSAALQRAVVREAVAAGLAEIVRTAAALALSAATSGVGSIATNTAFTPSLIGNPDVGNSRGGAHLLAVLPGGQLVLALPGADTRAGVSAVAAVHAALTGSSSSGGVVKQVGLRAPLRWRLTVAGSCDPHTWLPVVATGPDMHA
jgi:hypothetical protein